MEQLAGFGKAMLPEFMFEKGYVNINNGSFGSCPKEVFKIKIELQTQLYKNPEKFQRIRLEQIIKDVRNQTAQIIKAKPSNIVIVDNSTTAYNAFLRSLEWKEGDVVLIFNVSYSSLQACLEYLVTTQKIKVLIVPFSKNNLLTAESILNVISQTIDKEERIVRLAIVDHISCSPSILFPIQEIVDLLHEKDIPVFVDGAHAFGQVEIDIQALKPAAYCSNYHKWGFTTLSSSFLYISQKYLNRVYPCVIGSLHGQGKDRQFFWQGTRDITSYCTIPPAIKYMERMKKKGMQQYCSKTCQEVTDYLSSFFKTEALTTNPAFTKYMNNIQLPIFLSKSLADDVAERMLNEHNFYPTIFNFDGRTYWRISVQVYNEMSDYEFAANKLQEVMLHLNEALE